MGSYTGARGGGGSYGLEIVTVIKTGNLITPNLTYFCNKFIFYILTSKSSSGILLDIFWLGG